MSLPTLLHPKSEIQTVVLPSKKRLKLLSRIGRWLSGPLDRLFGFAFEE